MYPLGHDQTPLCHPSRQESVVARMLELSKFHLYIWIYTNRLLGSQPCSSLNSIAIALTIRFAGLLIKLVLSAWSSMSIGRMNVPAEIEIFQREYSISGDQSLHWCVEWCAEDKWNKIDVAYIIQSATNGFRTEGNTLQCCGMGHSLTWNG